MRKVLIPFIGVIITCFSSYGQNVGIGTSTPAAKLDISSSNSGLLIPRVALSSTATAGPVTSPVSSMLVYNTATAGSGATAVTPGFYYWNGSAWLRLADQTVTGATGPTAQQVRMEPTEQMELPAPLVQQVLRARMELTEQMALPELQAQPAQQVRMEQTEPMVLQVLPEPQAQPAQDIMPHLPAASPSHLRAV